MSRICNHLPYIYHFKEDPGSLELSHTVMSTFVVAGGDVGRLKIGIVAEVEEAFLPSSVSWISETA